MSVLRENYDITEDWEGERYIGMHLRWDCWDYKGRMVHMAMPGYVEKALKEFQHEQPSRQQNSPYVAAPKRYGAKAQVMDDPEDYKEVTAAEKKFIQQVTGKFLYLGRAIDGTLLAPLPACSIKAELTN